MSDIAVLRLLNQQLEQPRFKRPDEVVAWLGAVQGQDYAGAKWSVGLRLRGCLDADVEQAIAAKSIVRTWALRGTLHFVAASDLRWLLDLVAPRVIAGNARRYRELGLDERTLSRSNGVLVKALKGGKPLNRTALRAILEKSGLSTEGQRAVYMLQRASLDGLICQSTVQRNDPSYTLIDESIPRAAAIDRDDAIAELARRYFTSRGPATLQDFVWWSGLAAADARAGLKSAEARLVRETIDGLSYWRSGTRSAARHVSPSVHLLPGFDEFLLGYRDRSASVDWPTMQKMTPMNGMLSPTVAVDGRVVGTWKRTFAKGEVALAVHLFRSLTARESRALTTAARRYGDYVGMPVTLE